MPTSDAAKTTQARAAQRAASRRATFEKLRDKPRLEREVRIFIPADNGKEEEVTLLFRAIGSQEYDRLIAKNPPSVEQRAEGASFNIDTFAPSLLAQVCVEPEMSSDQWNEIWTSPDWNRGEITQLFATAIELCNQGLNVPFSVRA